MIIMKYIYLFIYFVYGSLVALPQLLKGLFFFSVKWLVYLYKKLTDYTHVGLFLGSLFCSADLCVYSSVNRMVLIIVAV